MFRNRRNSQKLNEEFYAAFKQNFPGHGPGDTDSGSMAVEVVAVSTAALAHNALTDAVLDSAVFDEHDVLKGEPLSPRASMDHWRLTPSMLDPNSFSFAGLANPAPGYYTPTPGGVNTVYHNPAAGDLHTPGMAFNLGTPLSLPLADAALAAGTTFEMSGYHPQMFQQQDFADAAFPPAPQAQPVYPPRMLVHQDSGYAAVDGSPQDEFDHNPSSVQDQTTEMTPRMDASAMASATNVNNFRYQVTLNAPTAMVRQPDEIPISYLNKGQAYTISIVDSRPTAVTNPPTKYRTVIRISFEDDQQRQRPSACWQLWKEGRGLSESHQRGGKLQAVEFVDPHPGAEEDPRRPHVELDTASFDCFSVIWTPSIATTKAECSVAVRFNFLSTDFSHSKGVKGIPVRLCAKTSPVQDDSIPDEAVEVCYCKVKLFRDHGAERKLANDIAHVKKTIEKVRGQITQLESGIKDGSKRKRTASLAAKMGGERPAKMLKTKRTWSLSSHEGGGRPAIEDDLHQRLAAVQAMFTSTRPVSVLYLRGGEQDDPDRFPVALPNERTDTGKEASSRLGSWPSGAASPGVSSAGSPASSLGERAEGTFKVPRKKPPVDWPMSATLPSTNFSAALAAVRHGQPVRVAPGIDAIDMDPSYVPPPPTARALACFYARIETHADRHSGRYYRAVYLSQRTVDALVSGIAAKSEVDPARVERTIRVTPQGLSVLVDDEMVRELPEGQDMVVDFVEIASIKAEDDGGAASVASALAVPARAGDSNVTTPLAATPLEMRLRF